MFNDFHTCFSNLSFVLFCIVFAQKLTLTLTRTPFWCKQTLCFLRPYILMLLEVFWRRCWRLCWSSAGGAAGVLLEFCWRLFWRLFWSSAGGSAGVLLETLLEFCWSSAEASISITFSSLSNYSLRPFSG